MQKITPHFWFDHQADDAAEFYASSFSHSKIGKKSYYGKSGFDIRGQLTGKLMTIEFELGGKSLSGKVYERILKKMWKVKLQYENHQIINHNS